MTRTFRDGILIAVEPDGAAQPLLFVWRATRHPVDQITNRWRVNTEWWKVQIVREYFQVTTQTGLWVVLFRDCVADEWFMQRLYD
jgi:hypothetical protein